MTMRLRGLYLASLLALVAVQGRAQPTTPLRIGYLTDLNGSSAAVDGAAGADAARMAIEDFGGKVLGRPVELLVGDHQNKPDVGLGVARRWYDAEGVNAIFDINFSSLALAVQGLAREKNRIAMFTNAGTSDLSGKACSPNGIAWRIDTYAEAYVPARFVTQAGGDSWFFITVDYAYGLALESDARSIIEQNGGRVLGSVRHPFNAADLGAFVLEAQNSGAKVVGLANVTTDMVNTVKAASDFGLSPRQKIVPIDMYEIYIQELGLQAAQGIQFATTFYWDYDDKTRSFARRFGNRNGGHMPTMQQANAYVAMAHYLKAMQAAGTDQAEAVMRAMRDLPVDDFMTAPGFIRSDGRYVRDVSLVEVKSPAESHSQWDDLKVIGTIRGSEAYRPMATCK